MVYRFSSQGQPTLSVNPEFFTRLVLNDQPIELKINGIKPHLSPLPGHIKRSELLDCPTVMPEIKRERMYNRMGNQRIRSFRQTALLLFNSQNSGIVIILKIPVPNFYRIPRQTDTPFTVNVIDFKFDFIFFPVYREIKNHNIIVVNFSKPSGTVAFQRIAILEIQAVINPGSGNQLVDNDVITRYQGWTHRISRYHELVHHIDPHRYKKTD